MDKIKIGGKSSVLGNGFNKSDQMPNVELTSGGRRWQVHLTERHFP